AAILLVAMLAVILQQPRFFETEGMDMLPPALVVSLCGIALLTTDLSRPPIFAPKYFSSLASSLLVVLCHLLLAFIFCVLLQLAFGQHCRVDEFWRTLPLLTLFLAPLLLVLVTLAASPLGRRSRVVAGTLALATQVSIQPVRPADIQRHPRAVI